MTNFPGIPASHRVVMDRAMPILQKDARILGVAAGGSWITQTMDKYSDIDLVIVVKDEFFSEVMGLRMGIAGSLGKLLSGFTGEHVGEPRMIICLYDDPLLHVDLKFTSLADFAKRIEDPIVVWERNSELSQTIKKYPGSHPMPEWQWIEDRFWVWIHYAATKLGRGELLEVIDGLAFLRNIVLGPLCHVQHGQLPRGIRRIESLAPDSLGDFRKTLPEYDRKACGDAIESSVIFYRKLRAEIGPSGLILRTEAEKRAVAYLNSIRAI